LPNTIKLASALHYNRERMDLDFQESGNNGNLQSSSLIAKKVFKSTEPFL